MKRGYFLSDPLRGMCFCLSSAGTKTILPVKNPHVEMLTPGKGNAPVAIPFSCVVDVMGSVRSPFLVFDWDVHASHDGRESLSFRPGHRQMCASKTEETRCCPSGNQRTS